MTVINPKARLDASVTGFTFLVNNDEQGFFFPELKAAHQPPYSPQILREVLEGVIARFAELGVDATSWCLWSWFKCEGGSPAAEKRDGRPCWDCWAPLYAANQNPVDILIDACRRHNQLFIAGMRMNDRHAESQGVPKGKFITDHPEYQLQGMSRGSGLAVDYRHAAVREKVLEYIEDLLARHDVDGIEFDWMRWCHMFTPGSGREHAHLLTDFTRQARALLDAAAQRRGHGRLLLGARVPAGLDEALSLGYDVPAWIRENLVDYLCPTCFFSGDPNLAVADYVAATRATGCRVYPSGHFNAGASLRGWQAHWLRKVDKEYIHMTPELYRGLFRSFQSAGAHGTQAYNIFCFENPGIIASGRHGSLNDYSEALRTFKSPATREYAFYPGFFDIAPNATGVAHVRHVEIPDGATAGMDRFSFVLGEKLDAPGIRSRMSFRVFIPSPEVDVTILVNGTPLPPQSLSFTNEIFETLEYRQYNFLLDKDLASLFRRGENTFGVRVDDPAVTELHKVLAGDLCFHVEE